VIRKLLGDFNAKDLAITDVEVTTKMDEFLAQAIQQVKAGL